MSENITLVLYESPIASGLWYYSSCFPGNLCRMAGRKSLNKLIEEAKKRGGRPRINLPVDKIKELRKQGLGYKAIATKLKKQGYQCSYFKIQ